MTAEDWRIGQVQILRRAMLLTAVAVAFLALTVVVPFHMGETYYHFWTEMPGYCAIVAAIGLRLWCTLHIGSRKSRKLVTEGPYSVTRNPLYLASILGAVGVGLQTGMVTFAVIGGGLVTLVFSWVVRKEEQYLSGMFGAEYAAYCARTPRFLPRLSLYRDTEPVREFETAALWRTLRDSSPFLLAILLTEGLEALHEIGWLPSLFVFY